MDLINHTGFATAAFAASIRLREDSITLVVKGTFELVANGVARPREAAAQQPLCADTPFADGADKSLYYPSDRVPFKPAADVVIIGNCHAPAGRAMSAGTVAVSIAGRGKALAVFGDRHWEVDERGALRISAPQSFATLPLRWEGALGGPDYLRNPFGKGRDELTDANGTTRFPLPNVEDPGDLINHPDDEPVPAGFAPLPSDSLIRAQKAGTRDKAWTQRRAPVPPLDFEWSYYNAAPEDQQIEGYLHGDEELQLQGMHPVHRLLRCRLPGLAVHAFAAADADGGGLVRVAMRLDTLWVDVDAANLVLVWRGLAPGSLGDGRAWLLAAPLQSPPPTLQEATECLRAAASPSDPALAQAQAEVAAALDAANAQVDPLRLDAATVEALRRERDPMAWLTSLTEAMRARQAVAGVAGPAAAMSDAPLLAPSREASR